jgi:hypothetical protein
MTQKAAIQAAALRGSFIVEPAFLVEMIAGGDDAGSVPRKSLGVSQD